MNRTRRVFCRDQLKMSQSPAPVHPSTFPQISADVSRRRVERTDYHSNIQAWSNSSTARASSSRTTRSRTTRSSNLAAQPSQPSPLQPQQTQSYNIPYYQPPPVQPQYFPPSKTRTNPPRPILQTTPQALHSTYPSRLRTGSTLLMQPVLSAISTTQGAGDGGLRSVGGAAGRSRRSTAINYAEPPSGDEGLDAGAIDSEDSDFIASGGVRTSIRRAGRPAGGTPYGRGTPQPGGGGELDQSYLGMIPPSRFIVAKPVLPTAHEYLYVSIPPHIRISHSQRPVLR